MSLPLVVQKLRGPVVGVTHYYSAADFSSLNINAAESSAAGHWLFGTDSSSLIDLTGGLAMTPHATAPSYSSGYLTVASAGYNGLLTPFADSADQTIAGVWQRRVGSGEGAENSFLTGTYNTAGAKGDGLFVITLSNYARVAAGQGSSTTFTCPGSDGDWLFFAMTSRPGVGQTILIGDAGVFTRVFVAGDKTPNDAGFVSLGNSYFANAGYVRGAKCAEFIYWSEAQSDDFLEGQVYVRTKARLAARGITVL